ncbi:YhfX family PLP-dependent enzyme [Clostridium polynesiense]|uniref:YhfX family PLP-dependent enzyme n=1 Tax=Clostridium polynesiense TaxID=1325933 RepID=UPI00058C464C|nr:YhfX family PLP-dependent enzyme [Clostridium polynesiense]
MFLDKTIKRNEKLVKAAFELHQKGLIYPDTYILDLDTLLDNARKIKKEADKYGIELYYMTKQIGRNPIAAKEIEAIGYKGAVVVDFKEAMTLKENNIKLGHVGHLVQIPKALIKEILSSKPDIITVYSFEKAKEISQQAEKLGMVQDIMLRVLGDNDSLYPGQYGGFYLKDLEKEVKALLTLPNINITGITSFPCFLYDEEAEKILPTENIKTLHKAKEIIEEKFHIRLTQINTPSATSTVNMKEIAAQGGTHGEPGHALTGTTPYHAYKDGEEIPCLVYVSEVSHNLKGDSYCYGGGHYRRSHMENALVGKSFMNSKKVKAEAPSLESIDYHFTLKDNTEVGDTVVMAFRTQIFVTRSSVAVVKGIESGTPEILGIFDSQGTKIK